jgi:hypothetical protein
LVAGRYNTQHRYGKSTRHRRESAPGLQHNLTESRYVEKKSRESAQVNSTSTSTSTIALARGNGSAPTVNETAFVVGDNVGSAGAIVTGASINLPLGELETVPLPEGTGRPPSIFDDLESLRVDLDDDDDMGEDVLSTVPVRRPGKHWFRCHPSDDYRLGAYILEDPVLQKFSYVVPTVGAVLASDTVVKKVILQLCINRRDVMFWWPISTHPGWREAGLQAAARARHVWTKAIGDSSLGGYRISKPRDGLNFGEPAWPVPMPTASELLIVTFGNGSIIDSLEHAAVREL